MMTGVMVDLACTNTPLSYDLKNSGTSNLVLGTAGLPGLAGIQYEIGVSLANFLICYVALTHHNPCVYNANYHASTSSSSSISMPPPPPSSTVTTSPDSAVQ